MFKKTLTFILAVVALAALTACSGPNDGPAAGGTPVATQTAEATAQPTHTTAPTEVTIEPSATASQAAGVATATTIAGETPQVPGTNREREGVFAHSLGPADAPPGWSVRLCPSDAWHLCFYEGDGQEPGGIIEFMNMWPIETLPDFQKTLAGVSLEPGSIDYRNPDHEQKIRAALRKFVDDYHSTFQQDRQTTYGNTMTYTRLETQDIRIGELPAIHYGFAMTKTDGSVFERWLSYTAFDGEMLYIAVAHYSPDSVFSSRSDKDLLLLQPYIMKIMQGMKLPFPVLETDVKQVTAVVDTEIFRTWAIPSNPVGQLSVGQSVAVTGASLDRKWWQVTCPVKSFGGCWVSADPKRTLPDTP